jgi:hypothetical protein
MNTQDIQLLEPVTVSGMYKATDGNYYHVYVTSPGMSRVGAKVSEEELQEIARMIANCRQSMKPG